LLVCAILAVASLVVAEPGARPHIVFVLADDLGWEDLPGYGNRHHRTPHLDQLAADGMRFTDAYAAPTCSPTRACLLTGKAPARLGITDFISGKLGGSVANPKGQGYPYPERSRLVQPDMTDPGLKLEEVTLAEALSEGGYRTGFVGKWHLGATSPDRHGFDFVRHVTENNHPTFDGDTFMTVTKTRAALDFLDECASADEAQPFFLYLSLNAIHSPIDAEAERIAQFADAPNPKLAAMISHVDDAVGALTEKLGQLGIAGETLFIFYSDNGEASPRARSLRGHKGHLYEGGIRVPLIVRWPGMVPAGSETDALVHAADFYPTLLDAAGLPARTEQHADGVSFLPVWKNPGTGGRESIAWHYPHWFRPHLERGFFEPAGALREGRWKLLEFFEDGRAELYDLGADPGETTDLAGEHPERVQRMRDELVKWRKETGAQMPTPKPEIVPGNVLTDFTMTPPEPPNEGILFVNHEPGSRSGHLGHALVETDDGTILAFYPDCSEDDEGHSGVGWMEVKRSTDGGQTWSAPEPHPHSKRVYDESDGDRAALCEKAVRTAEGDLVLFYLNLDNSETPRWKPQFVPTFARSEDDGETWSAPQPLGDEPGRVYDAVVHGEEILVLQFANDCSEDWRGTSPEHRYLLHASTDGGRTFEKRCVLPFETLGRGYGTLGVLPSGDLIAYLMNLKDDEFGPLEAYTSSDGGRTWSDPRTVEFAKAVRNPQLIEMDGTWFLHGRARGGHFVIYRSPDGLHWDDGLILRRKEAGVGAYSNSLVVGAADPERPNRLLVQASHAYRGNRTNVLHWWIEPREDRLITLTDPHPLVPRDGGEVVPRQPSVLGWTDRNYRLTEWPEALDEHRVLYRAPMKQTKFEVFRPGYVVVLTPEKDRFNQADKLASDGFERVDLPRFHPYETQPGKPGNRCIALQRAVQTGDVIEFGYYGLALWSERELPVRSGDDKEPLLSIPTIDISGETERHSFVARGTEETYQGHPDTVLYPDGKTMFATWAIRHAGYLGPLAKSTDAGRTWSEVMPTHPSWEEQTTTTPTIHRLVDPEGTARLFVFAGRNFPGRLRYSVSEDDGETWTPMIETGLKAECPPKTILAFDEGKRLVMWCDRRDPNSSGKEDKDPVVWQSESLDGGLTWSPERVVVKTASRWAQPAVIDSEDGETLLMLLRNNFRDHGQFAVSRDRGETWSEAKPLPLALTGHRHAVKRAPDGRLVVVMRDTARDFENGVRRNPAFGHFVAWVGTFEDILEGRDGQYRIKLLHSHAGSDTGYSGLELLPDGTFVATTYVKYRPGPKKHSVVTTRFRLDETDALAKRAAQATTRGAASKPNILLITVDDMNCDSVGAFGCELPDTTPHIDKLAAEGRRFRYAHVQVANCYPSRNVMLSGRFPHNSGVEGFYPVKPFDYPVMGDLMRAGGYYTAIRGKVKHSTPYPGYPCWDADLTVASDGTKLHQKDVPSYYECTRRGIAAAEKEGKPFCLNINISDPHLRFWKPGDPHGVSKKFTAEEVPVPGFLPDLPTVRRELALYYTSVRRADDAVGAILRALEESGQAGNTAVIFLSDHGMPFAFAKTELYHHSTRTPLTIRWPGKAKAGSVDDTHMVSAVDLLPTILDIAGLDHPEGFDGRSFAPLIEGGKQESRDHVYKVYNENSAGHRHPMRAIETKTHLYIFNPWSDGSYVFHGATRGMASYKRMQALAATDPAIGKRLEFADFKVVEELYDLTRDPDCLVNLATDPNHADKLAELCGLLESEMKKTGDHALEAFRNRGDPAALKAYVETKQAESNSRGKPKVKRVFR